MRRAVRFASSVVFVLGVGGAVLAGLHAGRQTAAPPAEQTVAHAPALRWIPSTDALIADLQARIARGPANAQAYAMLGSAYLQKARASGDPAYYSKADRVLAEAVALDPANADVFVALGTLALARHRFEDGLRYGERARELNPYKAAALGVIADAQVELGRYEEAVRTVQAMVDLRPDLASFARVSYIRELHGDLPGAVEAMQRAANAGAPGSESLAWTRVQLGHLYFSAGNLAAAEREYERTLAELPGYVHARAGLARVQAARADYAGAIALYDELARGVPLPEYVIALADVHRAAGNADEAARAEELVQVMDRLYRENGVDTDAEMALFAADRGLDLPGTLDRARRLVAARPSIQSYDVLAWALYQVGADEEAMAAAEEALRLGTRDSLLRYHAGMIAARLGDRDRAHTLLREALDQNPFFSLRHGGEARRTLEQVSQTPE
ncbi:MAG: tetratricopeptide repeat protein [Candidatus Rokubacteria bacterium]|nr:tetratricopeptide repeat protein [Candidatus Rokubacteria bacterium]